MDGYTIFPFIFQQGLYNQKNKNKTFSRQMSLLQNEDFRSKSRHAKNFTAGI
jgi:hypothetical protein